ncbi:exodeoxyribonuclease VII large subunit [Candidatus Bandiella euplotis]|uniref:Exodeoxyribonuclease 7 large subunit n=1 Tax=Candidatus Bandiella euplotis TaxID=1664265 RepID=A0ABZ0ULK0_9RICK|nr:exodeoxyribonuclease VII large subunit [Candidatus Bandiella woodruffii]WPX97014.1 Exodeoxyribonuclease 7 large subunit [Candidatus Bandiella woodruffii]
MFSQKENVVNQQTGEVEAPYTVTEISLVLKQFIETSFKNIVVKGEVSGIKMASSGHLYFSLKDENAVLNAICWRNVAMKLPVQIEDGMEVICEGGISTYPGRSNYQIIIQSIKLAGEGMLLAMLEERKNRLSKEGIFDEQHKKPLPKTPKKIGVITSLQGAVIKDILHRIEDRFPTEVLIWDVPVQGNEAAGYITEAIEGLNNLPAHILAPDVIIVARGGGSIEDLWAFNEELVIRAVYHSKIPIISAVGHETDTTLIDLVSDLRAPTPTAAAEFATPDRIEMKKTALTKVTHTLKTFLSVFVNQKQMNLERLSMQLHKKMMFFQEQKMKIQNLKETLKLRFNNVYQKNVMKLSSLNLSVLTLRRLVQINHEKLDNHLWKIKSLYENKAANMENKVKLLKKLLISYSHQDILKRGFSIVRDDKNQLIRSKDAILESKLIQIEFYNGKVKGMFSKNTKAPTKPRPENNLEQNKLPL